MKLHRLAVIGLTLLIVAVGSAAAMYGSGPAHSNADDREQASEYSFDEAAEDKGVGLPVGNGALQDDVYAAHAMGPNENVSEQALAYGPQIHDLIRQFLDGSRYGSPGEAISGLTESDETAEPATGMGS